MLSIKRVGASVRRVGLPRTGGHNVEDLNRMANETWIQCLLYSQKSCVLVSEELEEAIIVQDEMKGRYAVVFDPLTGLSDPPAQDMGAIFGVFRQLGDGKPGLEDVMQPARNLVAAGYAMYGSSTMMLFSCGHGVDAFTLDPSLNEFILTKKDVRIPYSGDVYSINEGYTDMYDEETQEMLKCFKREPALDGGERRCRYVGSMVADIHRTFMKGGIFLYPPHRERPEGRLKLLYEAGPMAWLCEQAGGQASTGTKAIKDIVPESIHTKVSVFMGSEDDVNFCTSFYKTAPWGKKKNDPMFLLRRNSSIAKKNLEGSKPVEQKEDGAKEDDGIICFFTGV